MFKIEKSGQSLKLFFKKLPTMYPYFTTGSLLVQDLLSDKRDLQRPRILKKMSKYAGSIDNIGNKLVL